MSTEDKMIYTQDAEGEIEDTEKIYTRVTKEEENYLRLVLLLTGISTRAVRVQFDEEFSPLLLDELLKKWAIRLKKLKHEGMISQEQWDLLFPRAGKKPESTNFDVTLMIKVLRHLTNITQPNNGWDKRPDVDDTSIGADLARIKYYRNKFSHLENAKIDSSQFDDIWNSVSKVIKRLGGCQLFNEAKESKYKTLNSLETAYLKGEIKELQDPLQIREKAKATLAEWRKDDKEFVVTEVAQSILNDVKKNKCVTIIGNSGIGKTATIRHVSLLMADSGYDVFPFADPLVLEMYKVFSVKMLFVVDDFCGCCSTNITELEDWKRVIEHSGEYLNDNIKLVVACRLQVFQDNLFKKFSFVKSCICNMSDDLRYSNNEFKSIAKRYLPRDSSTACVYQNVNDCFPLLCRLYKGNPTFKTRDFFQKPFSVYEREMDIMFTNHRSKYCALALCVCFNNCIKEEWLTDDIDSEKSLIFQELYKACQLNKGTLRTEIRDELETLLNSFLKKRNGTYSTLHDKLFDFLSFHCSKNILTCLIRNANSRFIRERFMLVDGNHPNEFIIKIPYNREQHSMFLMRMIDDWRNGHVEDVFLNCNMQVPQFRNFFFELVNSFSESDQRALANTCDIGFGNNLLLCLTLYGDITCILWCLHHGVDINKSGKIGATPLHRACLYGYSEIVKILIENQADINICTTDYGASSLYIASEACHKEIVKMLLDNGADTGKCASGQSPLFMASQHGHKEIVELLLAYGANIERGRTDIGASPLHVACEYGRVDVVLILLEKKADIHGSFVGASPLFLASQEGHAEIVNILLDAGADINRGRTDYEMSPLYIACLNGCIKIVEILLINKPEVNKCSKRGATPLYIACFKGYTEIVKQLLLHDADTLKCTEDTGESPLFVACQQGHEKIVEMLLTGKADVNKCRNDSRSPLHEACLNGYTKIVKMLLKKGATHNVFLPTFGRPIDIAVKKRHKEIVNILKKLK